MQLDFDLVNRVRNVSLAESPSNALLPVYEAISNSIHAIEMRFRSSGIDRGTIEIEIEVDRRERVPRIVVQDNGVGLDEANWQSFRTSDSPHKLRRGGKGVGRLSWLKVFDFAEIASVYLDGDELTRVRFELHLTNKDPIKNLRRDSARSGERGTRVVLHDMASAFAAALPKRPETVARRIAGHFLPYLLGDDRPRMTLVMGDETIRVDKLVGEAIRKEREQSISVTMEDGKSEAFNITHLVLHKSLRFSTKDHNWAFYGGNKRVVDQRPLDAQLGLHAIGEKRDCFYVSYVTGSVLDKSVNAERTGFTLEFESFQRIHSAVRDAAKRFLKSEIQGVRKRQKETVERIIDDNPTLRIFREEVDEFVNQKLSLNTRDTESVFLEMQRHNLRRASSLQKDISVVHHEKGGAKGASITAVRRVAANLEIRAENALAEYVRWRHELLTILSERIGQVDLKIGNYAREEDIHELIAPLRVMSNSLRVEDQNAWVIDDRLPHYGFIASDKQLKSIYTHLTSSRRPDILFDEIIGFRSGASTDPIILIEFKRPGRKNYTKSDNPVTQIIDYVRDLREGSISLVDGQGVHIPRIGSDAWFQAYVVADLTPNLEEVIDHYTFANISSHDGNGRFGVDPKHKIFLQVLSYSLVLKQAVQRNKVLFEKLGLTEIK